MKKKLKHFIISVMLLIFSAASVYSQSITNTLGTNGLFSIKDADNTYLTLTQTTGQVNILRSLRLENTTSSTLGVMFKGADRFLHNYGVINTFLGVSSGNFTMTGTGNSGLGVNSLTSNTTGNNNTALGFSSLGYNATGSDNTAVGKYSLVFNSTGNENTAIGTQSLYYNNTGSKNTALGNDAMRNNSTGFQNTAIGYYSLFFNNGNYNTALGYNAGSTITTGANLTCIGIDAAPSSATALDQVTLGNGFVQSLRCNVQTISSLSDARDKKNITDLTLGLGFLMKIKPRQFNWDKREWYEGNKSDGSMMKETPTAGFISQELDEAQTNENADWLNLVLKDNPEKLEATYGNLLPVMVKAIQELKVESEKLKVENVELKKKNERLSIEVESLKSISEKVSVLEHLVNELSSVKSTTLNISNKGEEK